MIKKIFLSIVFYCGLVFSVYSQTELEDVVYLKNGGVTRGKLLEIIPGKTIKIQTVDRNVFVYNFDEVIKVVKESVPVPKSDTVWVQSRRPARRPGPSPSTSIYKHDGFYHIVKFGPLNFTGVSVNVINGYHLNPYLLLGIGVGLDVHKGLGSEQIDFSSPYTDCFLPIYIDFRYNVRLTKSTFFMFANMGYSVYLPSDNRSNAPSNNSYYNSGTNNVPISGGILYYTGIGGKFHLNKKVAAIIDFGFKLQDYQAVQYYQNYSYSTNSYTQTQSQTDLSDLSPTVSFGLAF